MATAADTTAAASAACEVVAGARDAAVRLLALLQAMGADPGRQMLAKQIILCIDRALAAVRGAGEDKKRRPSVHWPTARLPSEPKRRVTVREELGTRVVSSTGDDGFAWRKYGEKVISHHRYRRFYFRCTYRDEHGCGAKKQVQQTQEDPSLFETTYFGKHTHACPRDVAPMAMVNSTFLPQVSFLSCSSPGAPSDIMCPGDEAPKVTRLPTEDTELMQANVGELSRYWHPVDDDQLVKLVSANVSFTSPAGGLESVDNSLDELVSLLWS